MTLSWPSVTLPMIVTEFSSRVPPRICTFGPITENGPISTSSSISAVESTEAVSAMRAAITEFSNCCHKPGEDEFHFFCGSRIRESLVTEVLQLRLRVIRTLRTTSLRHDFKPLVRSLNLLH